MYRLTPDADTCMSVPTLIACMCTMRADGPLHHCTLCDGCGSSTPEPDEGEREEEEDARGLLQKPAAIIAILCSDSARALGLWVQPTEGAAGILYHYEAQSNLSLHAEGE